MEGSNAQEQGNTTEADAVFRDFQGRHEALVKALITDSEEFYKQCDPVKGVDLCLFRLEDGRWEAELAAHKPPVIPNPTWGFHIRRDLLDKYPCMRKVAAACDSWLLAVAFFLASERSFNGAQRDRLFKMMNNLPTLHEIVVKSSDSDNPSTKRSESTDQAGGSGSAQSSSGTTEQAKGKGKLSAEEV
ncbi:hypothetical protein F3Y22_tig00000340pilonHSYRG00190 [Hibiscus syriacus]|uniref:PHD finger protein ALFIN-LIKE n=1 Tax=Hibiscus syriacus TaxID=106335 RepID=A0A6A3D3U0_HIBSY|nr:PHD finger protein ALFIN-LIKE 3-like [Hibiscus syriacus]KAE8735307.1 hypothetical protein F3Y22_tig00000340pilonHSYRG00190 [Hibiscus syriacus]